VYIGKLTAATEAMLVDFKEVPDMANVYNLLSAKGVAFHYVSAGPFQLLPTLKSFMARFSFPKGSLNLRILGEKGPVYKHRVITKIIDVFDYLN
jgi:phosphatidate phosphatase APP1